MNSSGISTAISDKRERHQRETDLGRALERGFQGRVALFPEARDVLEHHDRIVDDEAVAIVSAIRVRIFSE
jgi:hypothetical protein